MVCDHVVRPAELPRLHHPNVEPGCVTFAPYKGLHPLHRFAAILAHLGNKHGSNEPYLFPKSFLCQSKFKGGFSMFMPLTIPADTGCRMWSNYIGILPATLLYDLQNRKTA